MIKIAFLALVFGVLPLTAHAAPAPSWTVNHEASTIQFSGKHAGNDFTGSFKEWSAKIAFDPKSLETSSVEVTIDMNSASTGNKTYDSSLPSSEWLDVKVFPSATFTSTTFRQTGDTTYEADGVLTIKGIAQKLTLPFTLTTEGNSAAMEAILTLDRVGFDVGKKADAAGEWVSKDIAVTITVKAQKAP